MKRFTMWMGITAVFCGLALLGQARADDKPDGPPPKQDGGRRGGGPEGGGPGGPGGPPLGGFHLIPRFAVEKLDLTDDQKKQIADLEKECKDKLAKILTPEQMKTLETARPPRGGPGQGGGNGGGRGQGGGQGGGPGAGRGGPPGGGPGGGDQDGPPKRPQPPSN
jgi:hypothetical protein